MLIMIIKYAGGYLDVIWEPATEKKRESIIMMDDDGINIHTTTRDSSGSTSTAPMSSASSEQYIESDIRRLCGCTADWWNGERLHRKRRKKLIHYVEGSIRKMIDSIKWICVLWGCGCGPVGDEKEGSKLSKIIIIQQSLSNISEFMK